MEDMNIANEIVETGVTGGMSTADMLKVGGIGAAIGVGVTLAVGFAVKAVKTYKKGKEAEARAAEYEEAE